MIFQELLSSYTLSETVENTRGEAGVFSSLVHNLTIRSVSPQESEIIYEFINGNEEIALLHNGYARAIDFIPWDLLLGATVDIPFIQKQTSIEHFIDLVLRNMLYEGNEEEKRMKRIAELQKKFPNGDCDDQTWYEMTESIQGKNSLLVAGEIYQRDEFLAEGLSIGNLLEGNKAQL